jgi:Alpha/beta hydrolase of unknown function (DUF900)
MDILVDDLVDNQTANVKGYFVFSTAPINVEDNERTLNLTNDGRQKKQALEHGVDRIQPTINDVIETLYQNTKSDVGTVELVIQIHGYNTGNTESIDANRDIVVIQDSIHDGWQRTADYLNQDPPISHPSHRFVYLGYRWPSEGVPSALGAAIKALPFLLRGLFVAGVVITIGSLFLLKDAESSFVKAFWALAVGAGFFMAALVISLFILRIIVYFRDNYRARHFAVPDLVEFIRQLDQGLLKREMNDASGAFSEDEAARKEWDKHRIKLSFIGHSMGAFVTTETIRILSDVFETNSIGALDSLNKLPSATIGRVFSLGRLILVSPDIPVKTIISGRANGLRSSLRRFEEAYLFSSEGDLALRLASTAANYFSYPAVTRTQGYRLGNVTVNLQERNVYGIVNLARLQTLASQPGQPIDSLLQYIGIKVFSRRIENLQPSAKPKSDCLSTGKQDLESIADLFTYFDCTEYRDTTDYAGWTGKIRNVLICSRQKSPLRSFSYLRLGKAYIDFSKNPAKGVDVHGGYFLGHFSQRLIYRLAFLGFEGLLESFSTEFLQTPPSDLPDALRQTQSTLNQLENAQKRLAILQYFDWSAKTKQIQIALSSERYYAYLLHKPAHVMRSSILTARASEQRQLDSKS